MPAKSPMFCIVGLLLAVAVSRAGAFRFVTYGMHGGNNNVRNSFYGALEVAWLARLKYNMKVTIVAPEVAATDTAADMLTIFNLPRLARQAQIFTKHYQNLSAEDRRLAEADWNDWRCSFSSDRPTVWVDLFEKIKQEGICKHGARFSHPWEDSAGRFDIEWQPFKIRELYKAVRFRDSILQYGEALRQLMPKNYVAVHYRAGDKAPIPLLNCSRFGLSRAGLRSGACTHRYDHLRTIVSYEEILLDLWKLKPPLTIYTATHSFDDDRYKLFVETLKGSGFDVVTLPELKSKLTEETRKQLMAVNKDVRFMESWVDQYLASHAERFLPCATSTWTQLVVLLRRELGKVDAEEWVQLYAEAFRNYGADATLYQYYDDGEGAQVIPNFLTRCPAGTSISGHYCLCNNVNSKCVVMPKITPQPEENKGCLSARRFSPYTFRRTNGFHSSCMACRCDPFDGMG